MNEATGKTASCLAITEKRPQRPGGCVGIFFQLLDWNRRLTKKKLFTRKLLPPGRAKRTAKKFGEDEKMPKTKSHLIADENRRGFPNEKKNGNRSDLTEQKHEMKTAGLVVRLMGLESMPTVYRDKQKKASNSASCHVKEEKFVKTQCGSYAEVLNLEKGSTKAESRPQKLQKTGQFERRAVTRFGAEALQIRNVLSRSRKHQHPKLAPPVKSPRVSSSRNVSRASRLIDAATRILEPGLQATNRAKFALTYSTSMQQSPKKDALINGLGLGVMSPDLVYQHQDDVSYDVGVDKSLMGQTSCKHCANLPDVVAWRPAAEGQPFVRPASAANMTNKSSQGLGRIKPRPFASSPQPEADDIYQLNQVKLSTSAERLDTHRPFKEQILDRKPVFSEGQFPQQFRSQHGKSPKEEPSSAAFRQITEIQNDMSFGTNRIQPKAKLSNMQSRRASSAANIIESKDFVASNRSLSGCTRTRLSTKANNYMTDAERKICSRRNDSTPEQKKRTISGNAHLERTGPDSSTPMRQKNVTCDLMGRKEFVSSASTANRGSIKTRSAVLGGGNRANDNKDDDVISFTFNSPLKHRKFMASGRKESMDHVHSASHERKLQPEENDVKTSLQRKLPPDEDSLGALLKQKLKELTSQEEDESTIGVSAAKRSTAMILQELISALIEQQLISPDNHMFNAETTFQTKPTVGGTSVGHSHDGDHPSPGSVLEASFSNDSCFSSSLDGISGRRLVYDSAEYSCNQLQPIVIDGDLQDSATSMNERRTGSNRVVDLLNNISKILKIAPELTGTQLPYVKEVVLNAELLFGSATSRNSHRTKCSFICPFLCDELENLGGAMWENFGQLLSFDENNQGSQVKRFLFDSVIECLDAKYNRYCNSGFKAWRRVPSSMNAELLTEEVGKEMRRWNNLAGMTPDEIIEWEMSHFFGKWVDFEIEAFETGREIDRDILEVLLDEMVTDLWLGFF